MVEFTDDRVGGGARLARTCRKCGVLKWRCQYENLWTKRCLDCTARLRRQSKCRNCGAQTELLRNKYPVYYCKDEECQRARRLASGAAAGAARSKKFSNAKYRLCKVCGKRKPMTLEHFTVSERWPDGTVRYWYAYCRPCEAADKRARYATDERLRTNTRARAAQHLERIREQRHRDPEFDAMWRERKAEANRRYRARRRLREAAQAEPVASAAVGVNSGPEMPAGPLVAAIRAWAARDEVDLGTVAARIGTNERRFSDWERPGALVRMNLADQCLLAMDLCWFEVWSEADYPDVAKIWEG